MDWEPWNTQQNFRDYDKPLFFKVLGKDNEVPLDKNFNWKKTTSLDNIISNAKNQKETQTKIPSRAPVKDFNLHDNLGR